MKNGYIVIAIAVLLLSCENSKKEIVKGANAIPLTGTWKLLSGTTVQNGDTTTTDYTKGVSFIKIINETHFSFLQHDLTHGKDSPAVFVAGGGTYSLKDDVYTERLAYCSAREWEGNDFTFKLTLANDTLVQSGVEKVEGASIYRVNIEKYVRVKE